MHPIRFFSNMEARRASEGHWKHAFFPGTPLLALRACIASATSKRASEGNTRVLVPLAGASGLSAGFKQVLRQSLRWSVTKYAGALVAVSLLLSPSLVSAQKGNDQVYLGPGRRVSGSIIASSPDQLTFSVEGVTQQVPVESITRILLRDDPPGLRSVRGEVEQGQLEQASSRVQGIKLNGGRDIVQQDLAYYRALVNARLAMQGTGEVMDAGRQILDFLKKNPRSFRFYSACEVMGDLAMNLGKCKSAAGYYARLEHAQSSVLQARARVLQGRAWLRQGDTAKSARFFQQAADAEDDRVQALGLVGWATCEALQGEPQDGITKIEKVIAENDSEDSELFARAYNALGRCYEAAGKNDDAVLAYLHTDMLFYREFDAHAESLFHLSKLWSAINKPAEASKARQLLKQRYASTFWAKQDSSYPN